MDFPTLFKLLKPPLITTESIVLLCVLFRQMVRIRVQCVYLCYY